MIFHHKKILSIAYMVYIGISEQDKHTTQHMLTAHMVRAKATVHAPLHIDN